MNYEQMDVSNKKYVVLDVETNGLSGVRDDLLSISIYKPDDGKIYDRFLPLELNQKIPSYITKINGIRAKNLKGLKPLSQDEVNTLFEDFELDSRVILHYGSLDVRFIKAYFKRHKLHGFENMRFFNFKKLICSSSFSGGNLTKDNLCEMFGITGITDIHSGRNDCILEWELFKKINGKPLLATNSLWNTDIYALNSDYIVPVSYLRHYPNLDKLIDRPYIECKAEEIYRFKISCENIRRFPTNFSGVTIEHLIDTMLKVNEVDSLDFLSDNKGKLEFLGQIRRSENIVPMSFNSDGTVTASQVKDKDIERELNVVILELKEKIRPLIDYIQEDIFSGTQILSQELRIDVERGIMALCDLSNHDTILEIKSGFADPDYYKEQLFYGAAGRKCFIMGIDWNYSKDRINLETLEFHIARVHVGVGEKPDLKAENVRKRKEHMRLKWQTKLEQYNIEVLNYDKCTKPISLRCKICDYEWEKRLSHHASWIPLCPKCNPNEKEK